jgi:hypothetical protein
MTERKIDVMDKTGKVLQTYPITLGAPAIQKDKGVHSAKVYSAAGALRADIRLVADMDNAGVYETLFREPTISKQLDFFYGNMDLEASTQMFIREVTLFKALSS